MKKKIAKSNEKKTRLHPRNKNRNKYDLTSLVKLNPELKQYISPNKYGGKSIEFSNPIAIRILNKSLLNHYYGIKNWDFPEDNLCPPIPGRADYIHHIADLLAENNFGKIPKGDKITCLDIGMGASCIYPIIGNTEYNWKFIASDIDLKSINSARKIIESMKKMSSPAKVCFQPYMSLRMPIFPHQAPEHATHEQMTEALLQSDARPNE